MIKSLGGQSFIPSELIANTPFEENNDNEGNKPLSKSQKVEILDLLYEKGEVRQADVMGYEATGYLNERVNELVKSNANLLKK